MHAGDDLTYLSVRNRLATVIAIAILAVGGSWSGASATTSSVAPTSIGYDISFPQCGSTLPSPGGFAVVGVNDGRPYSANPCLATELQWAETSLSATPAFYVNTANPGPPSNSNWPVTQQTPQICAGSNSASCSYDYGWNAGLNAFQDAVSAETQIGAAAPTAAAAAVSWWLDVESGNSWETIRTGSPPTSAQFANDLAVVQGEVASLTSVGVASVGIYSTSSQWSGLVGPSGSIFAANDVWLPGFATLADAQAGCAATSFTGGRVAMIQYPSNGLDGDLQCPLLNSPTSASVPVSSSATFSEQLSVAGENAPVSYVQLTGQPALSVSSSGLVTTSGTLAAGVYTATGTSSANGASGNFSFALSVGLLTQNPPTSGAVSVGASSSFTDQLAVTGANGPVTFTQTSGAPSLVVSSTGLLTASGSLARGTYVARGTDVDTSGDTGTFFFRLVVGTLTQSSPVRATVTTTASATFTNQLTASGASGALTYVQTTGTPSLVVSPTGLITTSGALAAGSYVVRGTVSDAAGGAGSYFFNLVVTPAGVLTQSSPATVAVVVAASSTFTDQLAVTGASGAVTFTQTSGSPSLVVSPTGLITTSGALAAGSYVVRGTVSDAAGDLGTFSVLVTVSPSSPPAPKIVVLEATRVIGHVVAGRTVTLRIIGSGFEGRPLVRSHAGTSALVVADTGTVLTVRVTVARGSRNGIFSFTIRLANGKVCSVRYVQR